MNPAATVTNTAIVKRLYSDVLNQGRLDVADDLATDDFVNHNSPDPSLRGPLSLKATARLLRSGFSDLQFYLEDVVAENDRVAVRWLMHGVHSGEYIGIPATGRNVELSAIVVFRLSAGRLAEAWTMVDVLGLQRQIGQPNAAPTRSTHV